VHWTWNNDKNAANLRKHGINFSTATLVFDDALAVTRIDPYPHEERWQTVGQIGTVLVFVVHTLPKTDSDICRIISARKATPHERRAYEDGDF